MACYEILIGCIPLHGIDSMMVFQKMIKKWFIANYTWLMPWMVVHLDQSCYHFNPIQWPSFIDVCGAVEAYYVFTHAKLCIFEPWLPLAIGIAFF